MNKDNLPVIHFSAGYKKSRRMIPASFWYQAYPFLVALIIVLLFSRTVMAQDDFRIFPYIQNPAPDAMTIVWFSEANTPGMLSYKIQNSANENTLTSNPLLAEQLDYLPWEDTTFFEDGAPSIPYRHRIRIENLIPSTVYEYSVMQGGSNFSSVFKTAPEGNSPIRFMVYGDCETEPESTGKYTNWVSPTDGSARPYLVDQTVGYQNNLNVIQSREPDFVIIAGDLAESGGEQRDWDAFWIHNARPVDGQNFAGRIPLMPVLGNHDYYAGPMQGRYESASSERAVNKYLTYFEVPANNADLIEHEGRYYSYTYGPATFIALDVCNNDTNLSPFDTNLLLLGESDSAGGHAPGFSINSQQYMWLETRLNEAQINRLYTFVIMHHAPYSVGPHGVPPGLGDDEDVHSGVPVRMLTPLFLRYGVDAVFSGHDEMWERSEITGTEIKPNGREEAYTLHFYDVGVGGDGLRGPVDSLENPYQQFLAHTHAPEEWEDTILTGGGKHYGHLEVEISAIEDNIWQAVLQPVYVLPKIDSVTKTYTDYERRTYDDEVVLIRYLDEIAVPIEITLR